MFNPHENRTADGRLIVEGLRVRDYDYELGHVVSDDTSEYLCGPGYCRGDHWFDVERADGSRKSFNGERMVTI